MGCEASTPVQDLASLSAFISLIFNEFIGNPLTAAAKTTCS